jgi:hypothetical protein
MGSQSKRITLAELGFTNSNQPASRAAKIKRTIQTNPNWVWVTTVHKVPSDAALRIGSLLIFAVTRTSHIAPDKTVSARLIQITQVSFLK